MTHHPVALIILRSEAESFNLLQSAFSADISIWKSNEIKLLFYDPLELCGSHTCHLLQIDRLKPSQSDWFIDGTLSLNFEFGRTFCFFRQLGGQVRSHLDKGRGGGSRMHLIYGPCFIRLYPRPSSLYRLNYTNSSKETLCAHRWRSLLLASTGGVRPHNEVPCYVTM